MTSLSKFLAGIPVSPETGWRWRKCGLLETVNIAGRHYVTKEAAERFRARVAAGELARKPNQPKARRVPIL